MGMQRHARWVVHAVAHPFGDRRPQSLERVVKVLGMVNAVPDFKEHPKVIDGFSDLMVEVFGDSGRSARAAKGMMSLSRSAIAPGVSAAADADRAGRLIQERHATMPAIVR